MESNSRLIILVALIICIIAFTGNSSAVDFSASVLFIDYDGDGFNDKEGDNNRNGIPDRFEPGFIRDKTEVRSLLGGVFDDVGSGSTESLLSKSELFGQRKFEARVLWQCHRGLSDDDQFGPGNGIGAGAKACAGGKCGI